jgi:tetratricopeptide (TPR) repeat protein
VRSIALRQQNHLLAALDAARESVRLMPTGWQSHVVEAGALVAMGTGLGAALASANRAVDCAPNEAEAHFVRGLALASLGRGADARAAYEQALALDPQHSHARNNLGVLALRSRQFGSAADHFVSAVVVDPRNRLAARNIATVGQNLVRRLVRLVLFSLLALLVVTSATADSVRQSLWWTCASAVTLLVIWLVCRVTVRRLPSGMAGTMLRDGGTRFILAGLLLAQLAVLATPFLADDPPSAALVLTGAILALIILARVAAARWRKHPA